jgi:hypothetical protein
MRRALTQPELRQKDCFAYVSVTYGAIVIKHTGYASSVVRHRIPAISAALDDTESDKKQLGVAARNVGFFE